MARPKKVTIVDGQTVAPKKYRNLSEILYGEVDPLQNTEDFNKYSNHINSMNLADLQTHAVSKGLLPYQSRNKLIARLESQWHKQNRKFKDTEATENLNVTDAKKKELLDLLSDARRM
jgi:hypothetical protein